MYNNIDFNSNNKIKQIVLNVIDGAIKYYNYKYKIEDIIILQNDSEIQKEENPNKVSYHIIFRGLTFENHLVCKDFFIRLSKDYDMTFCDKAIYNLTCLRLAFCSKMGKNAILLPVKFEINGQFTRNLNNINDEKDIKKLWKDSLLTHIDDSDNVIDKSYIKTAIKTLQPKYNPDEGNINIEHILFQLPISYCDDYDKWYKIGMILYNYSFFPLYPFVK